MAISFNFDLRDPDEALRRQIEQRRKQTEATRQQVLSSAAETLAAANPLQGMMLEAPQPLPGEAPGATEAFGQESLDRFAVNLPAGINPETGFPMLDESSQAAFDLLQSGDEAGFQAAQRTLPGFQTAEQQAATARATEKELLDIAQARQTLAFNRQQELDRLADRGRERRQAEDQLVTDTIGLIDSDIEALGDVNEILLAEQDIKDALDPNIPGNRARTFAAVRRAINVFEPGKITEGDIAAATLLTGEARWIQKLARDTGLFDKSLEFDPTSPEAKALVDILSDIVENRVENTFTTLQAIEQDYLTRRIPGVTRDLIRARMKSLGLDYEELERRVPEDAPGG